MRGERYERYIARLYEQEGFSTSLTRRNADKGIDILAEKGGVRIAVQAKHYSRGNKVSSTEVQRYSGLLARGDIHQVVIVTTSSFTQQAREVATNRGVKLRRVSYNPSRVANTETSTTSDTSKSSGSNSSSTTDSQSYSSKDQDSALTVTQVKWIMSVILFGPPLWMLLMSGGPASLTFSITFVYVLMASWIGAIFWPSGWGRIALFFVGIISAGISAATF